jgi:2-keto-4-pentenoate hydratase
MADPDARSLGEAVARGMRAQLARRDADLAAGARPVGWKIGFNTPAIQETFGLTEPVVGYLTDSRVSTGAVPVSLEGWGSPAVEVELAIRVGTDLHVAAFAPALELVDLDISFDDIEPVLAGNICHRGVIFGDEVPGADPWAMEACVVKDGAVVAQGRITEEPDATAAFVRGFLAAHGATLAPGDRIIAGSVVPPVAVTPGDQLLVTFGPLGELRVAFA